MKEFSHSGHDPYRLAVGHQLGAWKSGCLLQGGGQCRVSGVLDRQLRLGGMDCPRRDNFGDPASCTWAANRLDAYVVGSNNQIYHQYWNGSAFVPSQTGWQEDLPETTTSYGVAVCTWGVNRQDMFVNTGSTIAHNWYNSGWNGNWNETHTPPVTPVSAPAASSWGVNRIDVVVLGSMASAITLITENNRRAG